MTTDERILVEALLHARRWLDSYITTSNVDAGVARVNATGLVSTFNVVDFALRVTDNLPTLESES